MKHYVIYEDYTEYNQFEGYWDIAYKEFHNDREAQIWMDTSHEAQECHQYKRTLIGPLTEC